MKKYSLIGFLFFVSGVFSLMAQESPVVRGDKEFNLKNYTSAIQHYQRAIERGKDNVDVVELIKKIGIAYQEMNNYTLAIQNFENYLSIINDDNEVKYRYGDVLLRSGELSRALAVFDGLLKSYPDNEEYNRMYASCRKAMIESQKMEMPPIKNQNLINSKQSEFGLAFFNNKLIFASSRITSDYASIHKRTSQGFSDFYAAEYDTVFQMYNNPKKLDWVLNTPLNQGTFAYNPNNKIAYYTQCTQNPDLCRLFKAKWNNGKWTDIKQILTNYPGYDFAHPALSSDKKTLYFSSNLPGGSGGKDIWRAPVLSDGEIGTPERLDNTINTPLDEMFPHLVGDTILLFSSDGHVGMGGLDIYYSKIVNNLFEKPVNLGAPINSNADDFSILLNPDLRGGYFCSNRNNEEQSDDIFAFFHNIFLDDLHGKVIDSITFKPIQDAKISYYVKDRLTLNAYSNANGKFILPNSAHSLCDEGHHILVEKENYLPKRMDVPCYSKNEIVVLMDDGAGRKHTVNGFVFDKKTNKHLPGANVTLKSIKGSDLATTTGADGKYTFVGVPPDDFIVLRATNDGYLADSRSFMTPAGPMGLIISPATGFDTDFGLYPIERNVEYRIENIYYEFDKATLLPESKTSLNKLLNILMENPQVIIKINSHTDSRGTDKYNLALSARRGASVVAYLTNAGIPKSRLNSQGYGESRPEVANAKTEEEHQLNRRTTFEIIGEESKVLLSSIRPGEKAGNIPEATPVLTNNEPERTVRPVQNVQPGPLLTEPSRIEETSENEMFRVQIAATSTGINLKEKFANVYDLIQKYGVKIEIDNRIIKYQLGNFNTRQEALVLQNLLLNRGLKDTFIITVLK